MVAESQILPPAGGFKGSANASGIHTRLIRWTFPILGIDSSGGSGDDGQVGIGDTSYGPRQAVPDGATYRRTEGPSTTMVRRG
jgi:hypothetical protein